MVRIHGRDHVMATGRDISEQKRAEARLRETKERLEVAASAGIVGVWDWDIPNDRMLWDRVMYHLYGITGERGFVARAVWSGALHPADKAHAEAEIEAALRREREFAPVFRIVWPDGSIHHIKAASRTTFDASGRPLRMVGVSYDITAQKNIEERLQQGIAEATRELEKARDAAQAASEAKSAFLANMSHELRTPLNGIIGLAYILQKTGLTPRQKDHLARLLTSSQHLLALLNDILNYVRINTELHHVEHQVFQPRALRSSRQRCCIADAVIAAIKIHQRIVSAALPDRRHLTEENTVGTGFQRLHDPAIDADDGTIEGRAARFQRPPANALEALVHPDVAVGEQGRDRLLIRSEDIHAQTCIVREDGMRMGTAIHAHQQRRWLVGDAGHRSGGESRPAPGSTRCNDGHGTRQHGHAVAEGVDIHHHDLLSYEAMPLVARGRTCGISVQPGHPGHSLKAQAASAASAMSRPVACGS